MLNEKQIDSTKNITPLPVAEQATDNNRKEKIMRFDINKFSPIPLPPPVVENSGEYIANELRLKNHLTQVCPERYRDRLKNDIQRFLKSNKIVTFFVSKGGVIFTAEREISMTVLEKIARKVSYDQESAKTRLHVWKYPMTLPQYVINHKDCKTAIKEVVQNCVNGYLPGSLRFENGCFRFQTSGKIVTENFSELIETLSQVFLRLCSKSPTRKMSITKVKGKDLEFLFVDREGISYLESEIYSPEVDYHCSKIFDWIP